MAEGKNSFLLYKDIIHTVRKLPKEKQADLFMTILEYVNDEDPDVEDPFVDLVFTPIKHSLKRDLIKYEETCKKNKRNGKKGGRPPKEDTEGINITSAGKEEPKKPTGLIKNPAVNGKPKKADSDSDSDIESDSVNDSDDGVYKTIDANFERYIANDKLCKAVLDNNNFSDKEHLKKRLLQFNKHLSTIDQNLKTWKDYTSHFLNWHKKNGTSVSKQSPTNVTL